MSDESVMRQLAVVNPVADVLRRARSLIDAPEKWCKGKLQIGDSFCIEGALRAAASVHRYEALPAPAWGLLRQAIGTSVINWNDDDERTHAEVLAAFSRAIELAERGGA
jgi:hypothetical protein